MGIGRRQFLRRAAAGAALAGATRTLAHETAAGSIEPFTFCVVADPHCAEPAKPGIEQHGNAVDKFLACVREMDALYTPDRPDFMLVVGDIHLWALKDHLYAVKIPIHAVAGNHESTHERREELRDTFPDDFKQNGTESDYYSFVHKGVRFIAICDAGAGGEHVGQLCSEMIKPSGQCEWVEDQLAKPEPRKIIFAHIPPEPDGKDRNMFMSRNDSRWFNALVRKTKPEAMFFGHLHAPTQQYRIGAARCFNLRSCCWNFGNAPLGFMLVQLTQQGITTHEIETGQYT